MRTSRLALLACPSILALASCGSDPADVRGTYTINVTNGPNGCDIDGWTAGESISGTTLEAVQAGEEVTLDVSGTTGAFLDLVVGSSEFEGEVSGEHIDATLEGRAGSQGSCAYTRFIDLSADVEGDVIEGTLRWYFVTNGLDDCGVLTECENTQAFNGTRPPRAD